jgi:GNAT superfamily N-acetyltransferase
VSASPDDPGAALLAHVSRRWRAADPLLPDPVVPGPGAGCGMLFTLPAADGRPRAVGACEHWHGAPGSLELTWGAARRFQLAVQVGGPEVAAALDGLLGLWRVHLAGVAGADDPDSAAVVTWPSRDVDGIETLLRRGFAPRGVVAVRREPAHRSARPDPVGPAVTRRAGPRDVDAVVSLGLAVIRYDAHFGGVVERPSTAAALRAEAVGMLSGPEPWIWLAERDETAIGALIAERPAATQWIAPMVGRAPVAYNMLTFVSPADRGAGVGAALVGRFHDAAQSADVPVTVLHYEQTNPLSAPFWGQQGYRPLWTSWEARPACTVR